MSFNVKIMGADLSGDNISGGHYVSAVQLTTQRSRLYKLSISPLSGMAADVYVWIFDLAAGSGASVAPKAVRYVPAGSADTWDLGPAGALFTNGIYVACSQVLPTDPTTAPTDTGNDKVILKADLRIG